MTIKDIKSIHFTGIKGVGMTALALCAKDLDIKITGSDVLEYFVTEKTLKKAKIEWNVGFSSKNIKEPDLLIYTAAHKGKDNIEVKTAIKKGIPVLSHAQGLGLFMKNKFAISAAGVGGKSTTAAMLATIFSEEQIKPSYAVGVGEIFPLGKPGQFNPKSKYFIAEADEYFSSPQDKTPRFLYQNPNIIILTNLEFDHPDVYKNINQTKIVFKKLINKLPKNGRLICCIDNKNIRDLISKTKVKTITYGQNLKADWKIKNIMQQKEKIIFSVINKNQINRFTIRVPGKFNVKNAVAVIITAKLCGIPDDKIRKGLFKFKGTKRRFEFIKEVGGIKFLDDYAHHPLEIRVTLKAAKNWFKDKRIIAVFQPHTYSRTKALFTDFCQSFTDANMVFITPIYASAREKKDPSVSGNKLAVGVKKCHKNAFYVDNALDLVKHFKKKLKKGDVVFTLGAGDIFRWYEPMFRN